MKKLVAIILSVLMLVSLLTACATKPVETPETDTPTVEESAKPAEKEEPEEVPAEDVTITWGVYETNNFTAEMWDAIIMKFEEANPGIHVEKVLATGDDRAAFWKTLSASGNFPDIVMEAENLAKIEGLFAEVPEDIQALFNPATLCTYDGKCVTIPHMMQYRMQCFYNIADFEECGLSEPETWDDFLTVCQTLKDAGKVPIISGRNGDAWTCQDWWITEANSAILSEYPDFNEMLLNEEIRWDDPCIVENVQAWQDLVNKGYYHEGCLSYSYAQACTEFQNGAAAMMIDGSWTAAGFDSAGNTDFGVFCVPLISGEKTYCTANSYWGVSASSENLEAAFQFVEWFFTTPEVYGETLAREGLYSTTLEPVTYEQGPMLTKFAQNYEGWTLVPEIIKVTGDFAVAPATEGELNKTLQNIFAGKDAEEELAAFQALYDMMDK